MDKIAIIGRGTAGCLAATHVLRRTTLDVDWYFDDNIKPQAVGEGSNLVFPVALNTNINFQHYQLEELDGSFKQGILKEGWGNGKQFMHTFPPPSVGYHFNANKFQDFVVKHFDNNPRIKTHVGNFKHDDIDATFIMDCSGKPSDYDDLTMSDYIPVNSVYVTQCYWDHVRFQHTITDAVDHGWVFGIPLRNRCSVGYMYNNNITSLEEVKEDVKKIFAKYNLTPSEDTNAFSFKNYYRTKNFDGRVAYNGNASFFLEPLEATSIAMMEYINVFSMHLWAGQNTEEECNRLYTNKIQNIENVIMLHYFAGSKYDTPFWDYAKQRGEGCMRRALTDVKFLAMIKESFKHLHVPTLNKEDYGTWGVESFAQNFSNLDLYSKFEDLRKKMIEEKKS